MLSDAERFDRAATIGREHVANLLAKAESMDARIVEINNRVAATLREGYVSSGDMNEHDMAVFAAAEYRNKHAICADMLHIMGMD